MLEWHSGGAEVYAMRGMGHQRMELFTSFLMGMDEKPYVTWR